ncbi:MAG TPA: hypothetical protein VI759_09160 [Dehalococcoidia bacterium]|nr:hypothetical protein [Dehalococcoidia bacterium]
MNENELRIVVRAKEQAEKTLAANRPAILEALRAADIAQGMLASSGLTSALEGLRSMPLQRLLEDVGSLASLVTGTNQPVSRPDYSWLASSYTSRDSREARMERAIRDLEDEVAELRETIERGDPPSRQYIVETNLAVKRMARVYEPGTEPLEFGEADD